MRENCGAVACQEQELGAAQPHPHTVPSPQQEFSAHRRSSLAMAFRQPSTPRPRQSLSTQGGKLSPNRPVPVLTFGDFFCAN